MVIIFFFSFYIPGVASVEGKLFPELKIFKFHSEQLHLSLQVCTILRSLCTKGMCHVIFVTLYRENIKSSWYNVLCIWLHEILYAAGK